MYVHRWGADLLVRTPAKLNLFFEVLGKRDDGFHEIETLMVPIALYDTLSLRPTPDGAINVDCRWASDPRPSAADTGDSRLSTADKGHGESAFDPTLGELPPPADNIVTRALGLLRDEAGVSAGAQVRLLKRIPSAAGLGGGSSDAAAALAAATTAWRLDWSRERLAALAARIGSDVPFFLGDALGRSTAAICRGRGELIEPVTHLGALHFVVVRPPEGLSTAGVYRACRPARSPLSAAPLVGALRGGDWRLARACCINRLEEAASGLSHWIGRLRASFADMDCVAAQMSGSGSSYFGMCRSAGHARRVARRLAARGLGRVHAVASC